MGWRTHFLHMAANYRLNEISYRSRLNSQGGRGGNMIDAAVADNKTSLLFCNFIALIT